MKMRMHVGGRGVRTLAHPLGFGGPVGGTPSVVAGIVDQMSDWDISSPDQACAFNLRVIPGTGPVILIQYRTPPSMTWQFGARSARHPDHPHCATKLQTGLVTVQPRGPLGTISVRLRPEAAAHLLGGSMQPFLDAQIGLDDLFRPGEVSLLVEMIAEAQTSAERFARVEQFLLANLHASRADPLACRAAAMLRRTPHLRVRQLADRLDVSERNLSRRFDAMFGMGAKQFSRIARLERAMTVRGQGATWAHTAYEAGFSDQAHMIKDFAEIVGVPPAELVRPSSPMSAPRTPMRGSLDISKRR
ncbi:hypothetical protein BRAS3843_3040002 [Bradyrhizobium sp. STM 3843]|uniref:helix-turn-helix domain-containing protein n=1 Tax=Bradyrhizobium sp. STM 3843 TaxID=551947 RepID=UPI0002403D06|nr:AraC family transcriptional regulator [Bradyrhizobium sp. STM 3843]CCE09117.1 hypothetical protein BRAS3843_3040002 [Bradyrhizobium sp. STM 3843]